MSSLCRFCSHFLSYVVAFLYESRIHSINRKPDTSATRHFGTTKLVPKFKTNHRWSCVSSELFWVEVSRLFLDHGTRVEVSRTTFLVSKSWDRCRSVPECLDAEVSCGRSVRYSLELCRSVSKSEGRRHLRSWAAVNSSYLVTVPWQPLVDVRLAMQDRKRGTHFRITWDATISVSKYSYDSWRRFCLHISAFRRGDVCEVTKEVELGSKYFWLYRPNLCVYWSWWQPFTALTVNTFLSPFSWKKTPVRRALWYICLILVAPLAHLTGRATWHFSRRIIVWTPFDTATAFPEVPCYRRRYLRHVGPIADDSDEVQFFSHLLYSGLVTMWNESTRLKSRAIAGNRAMPL